MAAKSKKVVKMNGAVKLLCFVTIALGIFVVIGGVLSEDVESWRALLMATGFAILVAGTIGYSKTD